MSYDIAEIVVGWTMVLWGVGSLINPKVIQSYIQFSTSNDEMHETVSYLVYPLLFILGLIVITIHNDWYLHLSVITTIAGWVLTLKAFGWIAFRKHFKRLAKKLSPTMSQPWFNYTYSGVMVLLGLAVLWNVFYSL